MPDQSTSNRSTQSDTIQLRSSDPSLCLHLLVYETTPSDADEFTLYTSPGLPIIPGSPFYTSLQELWSQNGNQDAIPCVGLIRAVAADIERMPRLVNFAIYRSWYDHGSAMQYVLLQSIRTDIIGIQVFNSRSRSISNRRGRGSQREN